MMNLTIPLWFDLVGQLSRFMKIFSEDEAEKSDDGGETELEAPPAKDSNVTKWVVCSGNLLM